MRVYKLNSIFPLPRHRTFWGNEGAGADPAQFGQRQEASATTATPPPAHQSIKARRLPEGKICIPSRSSSKLRTSRTRRMSRTRRTSQTICVVRTWAKSFCDAGRPDDLMGRMCCRWGRGGGGGRLVGCAGVSANLTADVWSKNPRELAHVFCRALRKKPGCKRNRCLLQSFLWPIKEYVRLQRTGNA